MIPSKIALLMPRLATEHVGELVATRDAIDRALRSEALDWHDLARACFSSERRRTVPSGAPHRPSFGDMARACRDLDRGRLKPRERTFVADMVRRGFSFRPSPQQDAWLVSIFDGLQARAAA